MNNQQRYLIRLQPLAPFFFGGEQGQTADYYLKGNNFPQQTALLGLLRHQLLIQNGLLSTGKIDNISGATSLIGSESFQYNRTDQKFGVIDEISECFICYTSQNIPEDTVSFCQYSINMPTYASSISLLNDHYVFTDFNPKKYYKQNFIRISSFDNCFSTITDDKIFKTIERPGIDKSYDGQPKEDAYYKQVWLSMKNGYSFGFYANISDLEESKPVVLQNALVNFGKESSPFMMTIEVAESSPQIDESEHKYNALYLTSDAYATEDIAIGCELAITDTIPFRNFINHVSQSSQAYYNRKPSQIAGSARLQLYKKGSFFYSKENIQVVADNISKHKNFFKIGYNRFRFTTINI